MTDFEKKVLQTIKHNPDHMSGILKKRYDMNNVYRVLKKYLPFSLGIEVEVFDANKDDPFGETRFKKYQKHWYKFIKKYSSAVDLERQSSSRDPGEYTIRLFRTHEVVGGKKKYIRDLIIFNKLLNYFKKYTKLNIGGGIHIHTDNRDRRFMKNSYDKCFPRSWVEKLVEFHDFDGSYNSIRVGRGQESTVVRFEARHPTIEYRMGYMTYEFAHIFTWMLGCSYASKCSRHLNKTKQNIFKPEVLDMFKKL